MLVSNGTASSEWSYVGRDGLPDEKTYTLNVLCRVCHFGVLAFAFDRDSPDESQTGINVRVFPALLQDRREVLTATSTSGNPNAWSRV